MKHKKIGLFFIVLGVLSVLAGAGLMLFNLFTDKSAADALEQTLVQLDLRIESREAGEAEADDSPVGEPPGEGVMPYVVIDGSSYVGYLSIPNLDLRLPVLSSWSYANLRVAPSLYSGSVYGNNMVIAAHNYSSHFGRLNTLYTGAEILFTDVDGNTTVYYIEKGEELEPTEVARMKSSDYDLSLFTCNFDGSARFTVRCKRA